MENKIPPHASKISPTPHRFSRKTPGHRTKTASALHIIYCTHRSLGKKSAKLCSGWLKNNFCRECFNLSDSQICSICGNPRREKKLICVVENVYDAQAIERSGDFHGVYHILHGKISPLDGVSPDDLKIKELFLRIKRMQENSQGNGTQAEQIEIILATNPSSEGETTALYIQRLLHPLNIKITRIATGIPVGADLEYADEITLGRAIKGRQDY